MTICAGYGCARVAQQGIHAAPLQQHICSLAGVFGVRCEQRHIFTCFWCLALSTAEPATCTLVMRMSQPR
jgi:hypothetical protein